MVVRHACALRQLSRDVQNSLETLMRVVQKNIEPVLKTLLMDDSFWSQYINVIGTTCGWIFKWAAISNKKTNSDEVTHLLYVTLLYYRRTGCIIKLQKSLRAYMKGNSSAAHRPVSHEDKACGKCDKPLLLMLMTRHTKPVVICQHTAAAGWLFLENSLYHTHNFTVRVGVIWQPQIQRTHEFICSGWEE